MKKTAGTNPPGPEPFCGISRNLVCSAVKAWLDAEYADYWCSKWFSDIVYYTILYY
jgi:hypothetical protein